MEEVKAKILKKKNWEIGENMSEIQWKFWSHCGEKFEKSKKNWENLKKNLRIVNILGNSEKFWKNFTENSNKESFRINFWEATEKN